MLANRTTSEEDTENWNLPLAAIEEIVRYCDANRDLIALEADEEKWLLAESGIPLTPGASA